MPAGLGLAIVVALIAAGCGSSGSSAVGRSGASGASAGSPAVHHFESGPPVARITGDLEAIGRACSVAGGPAALRAARDLGALIGAGPGDTYGPADASQTLAELGRVAAAKASCARTPELRAALHRLGG
jgi:hypothetical protein